MSRTLIRHAQVVTPAEVLATSVLIEDDKIAALDVAEHTRADEVIEARGLVLLPGVIDPHVHFRQPGLEHKEDLHSGSLAAAAGGVTTVLEMPNTRPPTTTVERLHQKLELASRCCLVNYGFYIAATSDNLSELQRARRTPGIKIFMGSSTGNLLVDDPEVLRRIFAQTTLPIATHCEDEATIRRNRQRLGDRLTVEDHSRIRDHEAALRSTHLAVELAQATGHRLHVLHLSTAQEIPVIAAARGLVTTEVCPHHLFFNVEDYARLGTLVQVNPSLKTAEDNRALWQGLLAGQIQLVATDHAPHTLEEKRRPYPESPSGIPSVENSLALMLDQVNRGRCTLEQVARWMAEAPALVWDIVGKGRIAPGYDADLVLVDMNLQRTIRNQEQYTRCGWSPWDGTTLQGWPISTWVRGHRVYHRGRFDTSRPGGEVQFDHARGGFWAAVPSAEPG